MNTQHRPEPEAIKQYLTAREVADMLGVPTTWVYARSRQGLLPTIRLGHYVRYDRETIVEWIAQQTIPAAA